MNILEDIEKAILLNNKYLEEYDEESKEYFFIAGYIKSLEDVLNMIKIITLNDNVRLN